MTNLTAEKEGQQKNWTLWQCIEHGRMFPAYAGCSYCREGRAPIRSELSADSPDIHFAAVLKEYERGEPISASDLINALSWRVRNQRKRIADLEHKVQELENPSAHVAAGVTGHD